MNARVQYLSRSGEGGSAHNGSVKPLSDRRTAGKTPDAGKEHPIIPRPVATGTTNSHAISPCVLRRAQDETARMLPRYAITALMPRIDSRISRRTGLKTIPLLLQHEAPFPATRGRTPRLGLNISPSLFQFNQHSQGVWDETQC